MRMQIDAKSTLPTDSTAGTLVGRVWRPELGGPSVVAIRADGVFDISRSFATMRDLCESPDPAAAVAGAQARPHRRSRRDPRQHRRRQARHEQALAARADRPAGREGGGRHLRDLAARARDRGAGARRAGARGGGARRGRKRARRRGREDQARLAAGDGAEEAAAGRRACGRNISKSASGRTPRSSPSARCWPRSAPACRSACSKSSTWNNPEPEVVVVATSKGKIVGATLGNDVNLRDVEGRSALLLCKAKDNNASTRDRPVHPAVRPDLLARRRAPHARLAQA